MTEDRHRWHLKKELSLGDLISFLCVAGAIVVAYFTMNTRVTVLEAHADTQIKQAGEMITQMRRLEDKLDRLIERK